MIRKSKKVTIDGLARMVATGFNSVESKMATKADVDRQFGDVNKRLDRIENILIIDHKRRIEKLESDIKELKNALAM